MKCIKIDNMLRTARLIMLAVLSGGIFAGFLAEYMHSLLPERFPVLSPMRPPESR